VKPSIYEIITNQIVTAIEEGADEYRMPWHRGGGDVTCPVNAASGRCYRGLNVITLWMTAEARQFSSGVWATYRQWQERGARVRKGEKSASVFFWKNLNEGSESEQGEEEGSRARFVARAYHVFNADQVERYTPPPIEPLSESERIERAEAFFAAIPAERCLSNEACYLPEADCVNMPPFSLFRSAGAYYAVLGHEMTHWTGAKARLDRDLSGRFGSEAYAMEELVAELGAAFTAGQLALPVEPRRDHAPYIASWLKVLKNDPRAIFTAASKAQAAADYLANFSDTRAVAA